MALRLLEMVLAEADGAEVRDLLKECNVVEHRQIRLPDGEVLVRILLDAEENEAVLDLLEKRFTGEEGNRVVIVPVEATLPRVEPEPTTAPGQAPPRKNRPDGLAGRSCTRTSRTRRVCRASIWPCRRCPPSWRPSVCITTAPRL